jgi:hypothetical protein
MHKRGPLFVLFALLFTLATGVAPQGRLRMASPTEPRIPTSG